MKDIKKPLILIIDDQPKNIQFLSELFAKNGYNPAAATSGIKGLEFIKNKKPDLILLDIMMPDMDGYTVCKKIKKDLSARHIPIIFLTAKTETDDIIKAFDAGAVDYVSKPFNSRVLLARVKTHVEMKILRGFIPICSKCKKIRTDDNYWKEIEAYLSERADLVFSHSICPDCMKAIYGKEDWFNPSNFEE